jgi:flavin-dependent dehydrogenase
MVRHYRQQYDIAILGAGPAGSAISILLARTGLSVILIGKDSKYHRLGESLMPQCRPLLDEIGFRANLNEENHRLYYGNQSAWGSSLLQSTDFIYSPWGHGWQLDRAKFEDTLLKAAENQGADLLQKTKTIKIERLKDNWSLYTHNMKTNATFIVDATGRQSSISKGLGSKQIILDYQVALVCKFRNNGGEEDPDLYTVIESSEHGWWYSAVIPPAYRVVVFFTYAAHARNFRNTSLFINEIKSTQHISKRISPHYVLVENPFFATANTFCLDKIGGDGWLPVGDAAASYDPVSSLGLFSAFRTSIDASSAIRMTLDGSENAVPEYGNKLRQHFNQTVSRLRNTYSIEKRFPNRYWSRFENKNAC